MDGALLHQHRSFSKRKNRAVKAQVAGVVMVMMVKVCAMSRGQGHIGDEWVGVAPPDGLYLQLSSSSVKRYMT